MVKLSLGIGVFVCSAVATFPAVCFAQPIQDIRRQLSDELRGVGFAASFATLVASGSELELSSARYFIDDDFGTRVSILAFPASHVFHPFGDGAPGLYTEGSVGYLTESQHVRDIWSGQFPGNEAAVDSDSTTVSGILGAGPQFTLAKALTLTPILDVGLAYIQSRASYSGPGAGGAASLLDGIALNWQALTASEGVAARLAWERPFAEHYKVSALARYDVRWTNTIRTDDPAQEFSVRSQLFTLRADLTGPTGLVVAGGDLGWRASLGYRQFFEGDLEGIRQFASIGGAVELRNLLPGTVSLEGAFLAGNRTVGYSVGLGFSF